MGFIAWDSDWSSSRGIDFGGDGRWSLIDGQGDISTRQSAQQALDDAAAILNRNANDRTGTATFRTLQEPKDKYALQRDLLITLGAVLANANAVSAPTDTATLTIGGQAYRLPDHNDWAAYSLLTAANQTRAMTAIQRGNISDQ